MNKKLKIFFDVQELYYLPQYLPVYKQLQKENVFESKFIFHHGKFDDVIIKLSQMNAYLLHGFKIKIMHLSFTYQKSRIGYFLVILFRIR